MNGNGGKPHLFSVDIVRTDDPMGRDESVWQYLERSTDPIASAARAQWEDWLSQIPEESRNGLVARLRDRDESQVRAALAELVIFLLLRAAYPVVHVEPETGARSRPDFAVDEPVRTYLEVHRTTMAVSALKDAKRQGDIAEEIEKIDSPDFWLSLDVRVGKRTPSMRRVRRDVERWLRSLDYDAEQGCVEEDQQTRRQRATSRNQPGLDASPAERAAYYHAFRPYEAPTYTVGEGDWSVTISAHPRPTDQRGLGQFTIGTRSSGAAHIETIDSLRESVRNKLRQHKELADPLVVVLDLTSPIISDSEVAGMLYGRTKTTMLDLDTPGSTTRDRSEGIWPDPLAPLPRPAAVLILRGIWVGLVHQITAELWLPPDTASPLRPGPWTERALGTDGSLLPPQAAHIPISEALATTD